MSAARERERDDKRAGEARAIPGRAPPTAAAGPMIPARVIALQRLVGNAAVAEMLGEQRPPPGPPAPSPAPAAVPAPAPAQAPALEPLPWPPAAVAVPEPEPAPAQAMVAAPSGDAAPAMAPTDDPNFQAMQANARTAGAGLKAHQQPAAGAAAAQAAAVPPGNEIAGQAAGSQVDEMAAQQPGAFDRAAFMAAVRKSIDAAAPNNLEDVDDFKSSGKAAGVKDDVGAQLKTGKQTAEKDIRQAAVASPDTSTTAPKEVVALPAEEPGAPPAPVGAGAAMPLPRPAQETDLSQGPADVDAEMADAEITEEQLQESNEPDFMGALEARNHVREHAEAGPQRYRAQEQEVLDAAKDDAEATATAQLHGMHGDKGKALAKIAAHKGVAKSSDEAKRAKVAADIQAIYDRTKTDVTKTLDAIDPKVEATFTRGEAAARKQFEDEVGAKMDAYKDDRYSGWFGWARWLDDKLTGLPDEVNAFYTQGRADYVTRMDAVIGEIADIVGQGLTDARGQIADGRAEVHAYVVQLPRDLKQVGQEAEEKLDGQFEELEGDVEAKQGELVDTLAQKYVAARDALDSRIEELKDENKGYIDKAIDAVKGVAKAIWRLKDLLFSVLAKAVSVIGDIITHPIEFVRHLGESFRKGFDAFGAKIVDYLEDTLISWVFGTLQTAGVTLPKTWDLAGVFELVADLLGLGYANIRKRLANALPDGAMEKLESTVGVFQKLHEKGLAGIWEYVETQIGNFEEVVLGPLKDFLVERVIRAGIPTLIAMLNPATAFIRACIAIYDFIRFLLDKGSEIVEFIDRLLDSVSAIAHGDTDAAAAQIENTLKSGLKLAISLLASVLRLGGLPEKIRQIVDTVRKPVTKAIDTVIMGAVKGAKHVLGRPAAYAKEKYGAAKAKVLGGDDTPEGKQQRVDAAVRTALRAANAISGRFVGEGALKLVFAPIRLRFGLASLTPVKEDGFWAVEGEINPKKRGRSDKEVPPDERGTPATTQPAAPEDPLVVRERNRAKQRVSALKGDIRSLRARARKALADLLTPSARRKLAADKVAAAVALRKKLLEREEADDTAMEEVRAPSAAEELAGLRRQEAALAPIHAVLEELDTSARTLASGVPDPKAGDPKATAIATIKGQIEGARDIWRDPVVVAFLAANPRARDDFVAQIPDEIPNVDLPDATVTSWFDTLSGRDLAALQALAAEAKAIQKRAIALSKRASPQPLSDQRERKPLQIPGLSRGLRLANPGALFPDEICDVIDRAQVTLFENNKPSGILAEKSTQFAALAEAINGGLLPELRGTDHRAKNGDNASAYKDAKDELERLAKASPKHEADLRDARRILGEQTEQAETAATFVTECAKREGEDARWPEIPAWVSDSGRADLERRMRARTPAATPS